MPNLLKDIYNYESLSKLASEIQSVYNAFQADEFIKATAEDTWDALGLKDRIYKISSNLGKYLPSDYKTAISILDKVVVNYGSWLDPPGLFFTIFIELYGQDEKDWDTSIAAFERYTQYASAEDVVRSFIMKDEERMMAQMFTWSGHRSEYVRRLTSEGCRPQLPMAPSLPNFKKNPPPILPILKQLKNDPSPHVRKSVANNLNDISKTRPDVVVRLHSFADVSIRKHYPGKHSITLIINSVERGTLDFYLNATKMQPIVAE